MLLLLLLCTTMERRKIILKFHPWKLKLLETRNIEMHINQNCFKLFKKKKQTKNREEKRVTQVGKQWQGEKLLDFFLSVYFLLEYQWSCLIAGKFKIHIISIILLHKKIFFLFFRLFNELVEVNKNAGFASVNMLSSSQHLKITGEVKESIKHTLLRFQFPVSI